MKAIVYSFALTALLGACASPPTTSAIFDEAASKYTVTQNGATHTFSTANLRVSVLQNGAHVWRWASGGPNTSGYARTTRFSANADGTWDAIAAGLDNGTYFAGQTGTPSSLVPTSGTASYSGVYGFVVNGVDLDGPLALTANFGTGGLVDTSPGIDIIGTISGANISGIVAVAGESGTLSGMFIDYQAAIRVHGVAVGDNMAGVFYAQ